jgi:poly(A) polymerase
VSVEKVNLGAAGELAIRSLIERAPLASSLAEAFKKEGFRLALVGGPVRDAILGRLGNDLDFTTDAHPHQTKKILKSWADNVWDTGILFGTVAGKRGDTTVEVTTYRTEQYEENSRNPDVNSVTPLKAIYHVATSLLTRWRSNLRVQNPNSSTHLMALAI